MLKYQNTGTKYGCSIVTRILIGLKYLKAYSYSIGLEIDNACSCDNITQETLLHYMFCTKYTEHVFYFTIGLKKMIKPILKTEP